MVACSSLRGDSTPKFMQAVMLPCCWVQQEKHSRTDGETNLCSLLFKELQRKFALQV